MLGLYDSGIGGFYPLQLLLNEHPETSFLYLADQAFFPLGEKSLFTVQKRAKIGAAWLKNQGASHILIACHTASISLMDTNEEGMIQCSKKAIENIPRDIETVMILGTKRTVASGLYQKLLLAKGYNVFARPSQDLVSLIEHQADLKNETWKTFMSNFLNDLNLPKKKTAIFLGCTHFSSLKSALSPHFTIIDPSNYFLHGRKWEAERETKNPTRTFFTTGGNLSVFAQSIENFFPGFPYICRQVKPLMQKEKTVHTERMHLYPVLASG